MVMFQFEAKELIAAGNARWPGVRSMNSSMEYIYWHGNRRGGWKGGTESV
jgi:hypothetical protein